MDDIQRQPAAHEDRHHRDEHAVGAALPFDVHLFAVARLLSELGACSDLKGVGHLGVAERDDAARYDVLQEETGDGEELAGCGLRPVLVAHVDLLALDPSHLLVDGQRERYGHGDDPDGDDHQQTHADGHARHERVHDHEVAVDGDRGRRERRHVDTHAQGHRDEVT